MVKNTQKKPCCLETRTLFPFLLESFQCYLYETAGPTINKPIWPVKSFIHHPRVVSPFLKWHTRCEIPTRHESNQSVGPNCHCAETTANWSWAPETHKWFTDLWLRYVHILECEHDLIHLKMLYQACVPFINYTFPAETKSLDMDLNLTDWTSHWFKIGCRGYVKNCIHYILHILVEVMQ